MVLSVAFQGEPGAYSQSAVYGFFGRSRVRVVPLPTLQDVFRSLLSRGRRRPDVAVVPIENSSAGSVGETIDFLASSAVRIVGETVVPVRHCLMANGGTDLKAIRRVFSHPQALSQCRRFLAEEGRGWRQIPFYDTAGSAKMISEGNLEDAAAIASELAAKTYRMKVLRRGIEDDHANTTRFIVVKPAGRAAPAAEAGPGRGCKTSLIFYARHAPGSLVKVLDCFSSRGVNLLKIESRPIRGKPWQYSFFVDVEGHAEGAPCRQAILELRSRAVSVKLLGSYPTGT